MACMCPHPTAFYRREQKEVDSDKKKEGSEKQEVLDVDGDVKFGKERQKSNEKEVK